MAEHGQAFIVLHSTAADDTISRIVPRLHPGAAVTTFKNIVDKVVTEYGVAELRRQLDRRPHPAADRHRPPEVPRRARAGGPGNRLPLRLTP